MSDKNQLTGRQDPIPEVSLEVKQRQLKLIEDFLDLRWLKKDNYDPLKQLWERKDSLATIELLTFGHALETFKTKVSDSVYKKAATVIKSKDSGNSAGAIFEILASSMFENEDQKVEIPRDNNPGFDFSINFENDAVIRFSVKALIDSIHAKEFRDFSREICGEIKSCIKEHSVLFMLQQNFDQTNKFNVKILKNSIKEAALRGTPGIPYFTNNKWLIRLDKLYPIAGESFSNSKISYTSLLMAPYHKNEQMRFQSKMQDAFDNLIKHCSDVSDKIGNGVIIRVPDSISLTDAQQWLAKFWDQKFESISIVIIVRTAYTSSDDLAESWLTYEFAQVINPKAKYHISNLVPSGVKITVPIGRVSNEETKTEFHIYGEKINMSGAYWYFTGHHIYEKAVDLKDGPVTFQFKRVPNVKTSCIFTGFPDGGLEMSAHYPPTDDLLIL